MACLVIAFQLVLKNNFTTVGASQLQFDLNQCLRAVLMPYSKLLAFDDLLAECLDACRLLALPPGSIYLLKESLISADNSSHILGPLVDIGVRSLTPDEALAVLSRYISPKSTSSGNGDI